MTATILGIFVHNVIQLFIIGLLSKGLGPVVDVVLVIRDMLKEKKAEGFAEIKIFCFFVPNFSDIYTKYLYNKQVYIFEYSLNFNFKVIYLSFFK